MLFSSSKEDTIDKVESPLINKIANMKKTITIDTLLIIIILLLIIIILLLIIIISKLWSIIIIPLVITLFYFWNNGNFSRSSTALPPQNDLSKEVISSKSTESSLENKLN